MTVNHSLNYIFALFISVIHVTCSILVILSDVFLSSALLVFISIMYVALYSVNDLIIIFNITGDKESGGIIRKIISVLVILGIVLTTFFIDKSKASLNICDAVKTIYLHLNSDLLIC